eukprot:3808088-Pyramimonas_sp.AAC.1
MHRSERVRRTAPCRRAAPPTPASLSAIRPCPSTSPTGRQLLAPLCAIRPGFPHARRGRPNGALPDRAGAPPE